MSPNFHFKVVKPFGWLGISAGKFWWEQWQIMRQAKKYHCQFIHHFYPTVSIFFHSFPQIVSIHDAIPWQFPEYNYSFLARLLRKFIKWSVRFADMVVTVSETSQEEIIKTFLISPDKITTVYNGYQKIFDKKLTINQIERILMKYKIKKPYIFYLGGFDVRKNVRRLVLAFAKISRQAQINLVIAGGVFSPQREIYRDFYELPDLIKRYRLQKRIKMIGPVASKDLPALYQGALMFVSPTLAEGFNIPILEAFASGAPVACSRLSATAEIADSAALKFNPESTNAIARCIMILFKDGELRKKLKLAGRRRAADFSWEKAASEILKIYKKVEK